MPQIKMRYGIDLGTTNSTICRIENGEPVVKKTDHLKDTLPSCVAFTRKKAVRVGDDAYDMLSSDKAKATKGSSSKPPSLIDGEANLFKLGAFDRGLKSVESSRER